MTALAGVSLFFAYHDAGIALDAQQVVHPLSPVHYAWHHKVQAVVRMMMVVAALIAAWRTRGLKVDRLLTTALIGASLDVYWQWYDWTAPWLWLPMALKYLGTSYGLMQFIRFAATFNAADAHGIRRSLYRLAPLTLVLAMVGFGAQFLKLPPGLNPLAGPAFNPLTVNTSVLFATYLAGDALAKLAMIWAALIGYENAKKDDRQRMLVVTLAFCAYALGTAVHFLLRLHFTDDPGWLNGIDTIGTLLLPIGLFVAVYKRHFFDVEFLLDRALAASIAGGVLLIAYFVGDIIFGHAVATRGADSIANWVHDHAGLSAEGIKAGLEVSFLFLIFLLAHRLYSICEPFVQKYFFPERDKRLETLRHFKEGIALIGNIADLKKGLLGALDRGANAEFVHVFQRGAAELGSGRFEPVIARPDVPAPVKDDEPVIELLRRPGRPVKLYDHTTTIAGELALPMPVGGRLSGFIALGPNRSHIRYASDEIKELAAIARETGASLYALQRHAENPLLV